MRVRCRARRNQISEEKAAYSLSGSPYGTFDQAGNVKEWSEEHFMSGYHVHRGGDIFSPAEMAGVHQRDFGQPLQGFRVAMVPEPSTALLLAGGLVALALRRRL